MRQRYVLGAFGLPVAAVAFLGASLAAVPRPLAALQAPEVALPADARTAPLDLLIPPGPNVTVGALGNGLRYFIRENRGTREPRPLPARRERRFGRRGR